MSKSFCKKPFNHIYVHTNGKMRLCCNTSENVVTNNNYNLFDIRKNSLNEYWNSQSIKNVRMNMLNDLPVAACKSCYDSEAVGYSSPREFQEKEIFQHLTDKNGFLNEKPKSLQIQFGNQCNLMCKMCSQDYSHMQGAEIKDMIDNDKSFGLWIRSQGGNVNNWLYNLGEKQLWFQDKALKENIFSYISENISHLRILGGEPFIIKSFFELLKYMEEKNTIQNKKINITSNCTVIHHNYLKILQKTKSFQIWCSIDGINERNSYIRYPSEWNVIQENLHTIKKYLRPQDSMSVHPATQILNIDQLDEIVEWWLDF
jgi:MoaA/NifB/PqqE/SkfB family radical SAM enzyme